MNEQLLLDQPNEIRGMLLLAPTKRCFADIERQGKNPEQMLRKLSSLNMLLFWMWRGSFILYTKDGVYNIARPDDTLLLTAYRPATLRDNNTCIKSGISVQPSNGIAVSIKMNDVHKIFKTYHNGKEISDEHITAEANGKLFPLLESLSSSSTSKADVRNRDESYHISEKAEEYLSLAEAYTQTDADIERAKSQRIPPILCWEFHAAAPYNRQDRTAYTAFVGEYDTENYTVDTKVQLETEDGKILAASIVAEGEENNVRTLTLLFDDQISFSNLPKTGKISLSYSDIQNEVRQDVIDGIRKGETSAMFLADVLGEYKTAGFEKKDLRKLDESLKSKKYPPNDSQVDAIHRGIEAKDILLVLGPPGTGKTTVILEWVKYFIKQEGKRVLISSQNNKAVDNVLERLTQEKDISAIRAGNESKVQTNMYPYLLENRLKQLRENVETTVHNNLDQLEELEQAYQHYIDIAEDSIREMETADRMKKNLEAEAGNRYLGCREELLNLQEQQMRLRRKLHISLMAIRFYEKWMVDPEKHPILRFLMTPFRGFFRKRMHNALDAYREGYREYEKSIQRSEVVYGNLSSMVEDLVLLELAEQLIGQETKRDRFLFMLQSPPDDSLIWKGTAWPAVMTNPTEKQLHLLQKTVQERRERVEVLKNASLEWSRHIESQSNYALSDLLMESVDLVGGTCIGINSQRKFARINFDVTIIDESGQIQIHNALVPMSRSPKVIMLGDHLQIPPMANDDQVTLCEEHNIDTTLLSTSLFERLYENLPEQNKALLDTQYRMPAQIADLLSEWFYDGKYKSFSGKRNMHSICPGLFKSPFVVVSTSDADFRFEYKPENGAGNHYEANLIISIVKALLSGKFGETFSPGDFGIISPYGEQVSNIRKKLKKAVPSLKSEEIHDMVASLDSFQGQERTIILYSCTRSNRIPANKSRIGFLRELRRLNVALSRPLKELVFIGDIDFLSSCKNGEGRGSEWEFSEFIRLMHQKAEADGEFIMSGKFRQRLEAD